MHNQKNDSYDVDREKQNMFSQNFACRCHFARPIPSSGSDVLVHSHKNFPYAVERGKQNMISQNLAARGQLDQSVLPAQAVKAGSRWNQVGETVCSGKMPELIIGTVSRQAKSK